jgi:hypothetical protein
MASNAFSKTPHYRSLVARPCDLVRVSNPYFEGVLSHPALGQNAAKLLG